MFVDDRDDRAEGIWRCREREGFSSLRDDGDRGSVIRVDLRVSK